MPKKIADSDDALEGRNAPAMLGLHDYGMGEFNARHRIGPSILPHFDLLVMHHGRVEIELLRRDRIELSAGQAILIHPHTYFTGHSLVALSRASVQHFSLERRPVPSHWPLPLRRLDGRRCGYDRYDRIGPTVIADIRRAVDLARRPPSPSLHALREAVLVLILSQLNHDASPRADASHVAEERFDFSPLLQWLRTRVDHPPSLDEMAHFVGCSPSHFRATFTRQIGAPPARFMRRLRHAEATRLLRETAMPIKSIARRMGYDDLAHFYRAFAAMTSYTPGRYRRRYRVRG